MGSVGADDSRYELEDELKNELKDIGLKLLGLDFATTGEQLDLFDRATTILFDVNQEPSDSIKGSLLPITMALALDTDEFLRHENVNIQIAVASCMNELVRISAPESLYNDDHKMEVIFKLFLVALNLLSDKSASNYDISWRILETMAKVKTCLFMMDLDSGALIIEMFHLFLSTIRSDHPCEIYEYMLVIMTMVIQESDEYEISLELVKPLLASVRRDTKSMSPISWDLGKTVIETCATKLKPCLQKAVTSMNLVVDDYAEIVISLCHDTCNRETMDREASQTMQSDEGVSNVKSLSGTLRSSEQIVLSNSDDLKPDMEHVASIVYSETDKRSLQRRKSKEHNLRHELTEPSDSSRKESVNGVCISKGLYSKKKESLKPQQNELELSSPISKKLPQMKTGEPSSSGCKTAKTMSRKNLSRQKEKKPEMSSVDYGAELLNLRIKVWWPVDETFYTGTVTAFDPIQKKHKITYDDDEVENLNLTEETWEILVDKKPQETRSLLKEEEANHLSPPKEPVKSQEKTVKRKRKARPSKDKPAASSLKRAKHESNSEHDNVHVVDTPEDVKVLQIKEEEENELGFEELRPTHHTESSQRVSCRSTKGYHSKQRCGRFFS